MQTEQSGKFQKWKQEEKEGNRAAEMTLRRH